MLIYLFCSEGSVVAECDVIVLGPTTARLNKLLEDLVNLIRSSDGNDFELIDQLMQIYAFTNGKPVSNIVDK